MPSLGEFLFAPLAEEKQRQRDEQERRKKEWDEIVKENPDFQRSPEEYNQGLEHYLLTGRYPTKYSTGNPLRVESGPKVESPLPGGGTAVQFPTTEVGSQPEYRPLRMGQTTGYISRTDPGRVIFPAGQDKADKLVVLNDKEDAVLPGQAYAYMYDPKTGRIIDKRPTIGNRDQWIPIGERPGTVPRPGGRGDSPQTKVYLQVLSDYRHAMMKGSVPEELTNQAYDAADALGLPTYWESDIQQPGFLERLTSYFGGEQPTTVETRTPRIGRPKASQTEELPSQAIDAIRKANGKTVTFNNGRKYQWQNGQAVEVK